MASFDSVFLPGTHAENRDPFFRFVAGTLGKMLEKKRDLILRGTRKLLAERKLKMNRRASSTFPRGGNWPSVLADSQLVESAFASVTRV